MAGGSEGKKQDECNNQIMVDCVRGKQALNYMLSGGNGQREASGWRTT